MAPRPDILYMNNYTIQFAILPGRICLPSYLQIYYTHKLGVYWVIKTEYVRRIPGLLQSNKAR